MGHIGASEATIAHCCPDPGLRGDHPALHLLSYQEHAQTFSGVHAGTWGS